MHLHLILLLLTPGIPLQILDSEGVPVPGAGIILQDSAYSVTNEDGRVLLPENADFVTVRALGYGSWSGPVPDSGVLHLDTSPVITGTVFRVTSSRQGADEVLPSSSRLGRRELDLLQTGGLRSAVASSPGLYIREYGGSIKVVSVSIRGSGPSHTGYFLDGHEISSPMDGLPGITISPLALGGMEISRGGGTAFLKGGMAGSVNLITEGISAPSRASFTAGSDGSVSIAGSFSLDRNRITAVLRRLKGTGGTTGTDGSIISTGTLGSFTWGCMASGSSGETEGPDWSTGSSGERQRYSLDGWGRYSMEGLALFADLRLGRHIYRQDPPGETSDVHDEVSAAMAGDYSLELFEMELNLSGRLAHDAVSSTSIGYRPATSSEISMIARMPWAVFLETAASIGFRTGGKPLAGIRMMAATALEDSVATFYISGSRDYLRPSMNDLYWPRDQFAEGNPDLLPERSWEAEAGLHFRPVEFLDLRAAGFTGRIERMIRWEPVEAGIWSPVNVAEAVRRGVELEMSCSLENLLLAGNLTFMEVKDDFTESVNFGRTLPYVPDFTASVSAGLGWPEGFNWHASAMGTGARFQNYSETSFIPAYWLLNTGVMVDVLPDRGMTLALGATNLLDREYQETNGFNGTGRTLHLGIHWKGSE